MPETSQFAARTALIVALGGFLMGFDASVISGVVGFVEVEFSLNRIQLGWTVASLTLTATVGMMVAGPLSDRLGRRNVLQIAAVLFAVSAVASAVAPDFILLVVARMIGGLGVGAALITAPMYIAEMAPAKTRGRLVSFNQLNIVVGISVAFLSNYVLLKLSHSNLSWAHSLRITDLTWRWMLGVEAIPACLYFVALFFVPESPRWLALRGKNDEALNVLARVSDRQQAEIALAAINGSLQAERTRETVSIRRLFEPAMKLVLTIGVSIAILQQITGINSVFFYAPMIFEQSGIGTDASFIQAILVGIVNLVFTVVALALIDRLGRRPLLIFGLAGIAVSLLLLSYGFGAATYTLRGDQIEALPAIIDREMLAPLIDVTFESDVEFRQAVTSAIGEETYKQFDSQILGIAISISPKLILIGILGFVASFAVSLGPVMWVLFSELFPNSLRGLAISFVGLINSAISFVVQLVFPWELENLGNASTFFIYALFAIGGLIFVMRMLPETKGKSLEELEELLVPA